jgi:hypothetical protein
MDGIGEVCDRSKAQGRSSGQAAPACKLGNVRRLSYPMPLIFSHVWECSGNRGAGFPPGSRPSTQPATAS